MCILISIFRWVKDKPVADRLNESWSCSCWILGKITQTKRPASKSYPPVVEATQDVLAVAKLGLFSVFANQFQPFLVAYQTENPMLSFLYQDLIKLIRKIMQFIVKPDLRRKYESGRDLKKIDLLNKSTLLQIY